MTNETESLSSLLQRLREQEPEWSIEQDAWDGCDGRTNYITSGKERIAGSDYLPYAKEIVAKRNRTRSRLLAVTSLLAETILAFENGEHSRITVSRITAKLSNVLKEE